MELLALAQSLLKQPSITPNDHNCQKIIAKILEQNDFSIYEQKLGETSNLLALKGNPKEPLIVLLGHTDVVPPGAGWDSEPFNAEIHNDKLIARGAVDMKAAVAAMVIAACKQNINYGRIGIMLTSDEEGSGENGIKQALPNWLKQLGEINSCLVGEPTSTNVIGDTLKLGRRGSINAKITINGRQGHAAYPELATNPIELASRAIDTLSKIQFADSANGFPSSNLCCTGVESSSNTCNMIPGTVELSFNIRFAPNEDIKSIVMRTLTKNNIDFKLNSWVQSAEPYRSKPGILTKALYDSLITKPKTTYDGGTSDGRFMAKYCSEVIEFGALRTTAHQANEFITIADLEQLEAIYTNTLANALTELQELNRMDSAT